MNLQEYLTENRRTVDKALDEMLPAEDNEPTLLHQAMRYSVFAGGKRLRPILAMTAAEIVSGDGECVMPLAVALECIHTYSLIHDDLPAMDDDDVRRGKPTAHKVFGEAVAILAGDSLLTFAFGVLAGPGSIRIYRPDRLLATIGELAVAAGPEELIGGQFLDIMSENKPVEAQTVERIMLSKTAALISASLTCGARLAGGCEEEIRILGRYGKMLGSAFQMKDDLLDLEGDAAKLGKAVKKDHEHGKATYPKLLGKSKTKDMMRELIDLALDVIRPFGARAAILADIGRYVVERVH
ncbi:MAG: polyprenyl synthetase family protein [Desulfomonilaceae bacterium]|nr:polyprenyl synthetase family protein [Desulfomonilaceae bacterium]